MTGLYLPLLAATELSGLAAAWDFLHRGGAFMIPLGATSVAGMMAILYKFLSLSSRRVLPKSLAQQVSRFRDLHGEISPAFQTGESTLARLAAVVLQHRGRTHEEITRAVEAAAREETVHLHAGISVLDTVITIAPLLGLLGTASGLVRIFQGLGDNSDHLAIASGIAEALTTTIFGLAIAVPCVIAHGYFLRRIETQTARLESLLAGLSAVCEKPHPDA
jgi:biopolymer transport protein ExbB